jgi:hypothetical protein
LRTWRAAAQLAREQRHAPTVGAEPQQHGNLQSHLARRDECGAERAIGDGEPAQARRHLLSSERAQTREHRGDENEDQHRDANRRDTRPVCDFAPEHEESGRGQQHRQPRSDRGKRTRPIREEPGERQCREQLEPGPRDANRFDPHAELDQVSPHRQHLRIGGGEDRLRRGGEPQRRGRTPQPHPTRNLLVAIFGSARPPPERRRDQLESECRRE